MSEKRHFGRRREPLQQRSSVTVDAIVEAACDVFRKSGYHRATTTKIAERAGVSVGTLYQYFPNKDAVLLAVALAHVPKAFDLGEQFLQAMTKLERVDLRFVLRTYVRGRIAYVKADRDLLRVIYDGAHTAELRQVYQDGELRIARVMEELLEKIPSVRVPDLALAAHFVVTAIGFQGRHYLFAGLPLVDEETFVNEMVSVFERYLQGGTPKDTHSLQKVQDRGRSYPVAGKIVAASPASEELWAKPSLPSASPAVPH